MRFEDEVLRAEREMGRHHGAREDLSDAISDLGDEIRDYDFSGESEMEREFERFARTMGDYLENDRQEVEEETDQLEDILEDLRDQRSQTYGGFGTYRHGTGPQPFNWGMQQQQGVFGQQQRIGWNSFWSNPYQQQQQQGYGHQQQQSQGQDWQEEFFGNSDEADILDEDDNSNEEGPADIDETADESESNGYEDADSYQPDEDPDGSVDMGDSWNPDASFDYEAEQGTGTVNQSFSFSGSGFEPSGSITMEQSAGGEQQYFEASF